jgi:hypothetical protein
VNIGLRSRSGINLWLAGWAIGAIVFALIVVWQNRGLTFFWDEWDVVAATLESPYFGILQDNGGNFFPLSRIVFGIELAIFGTWYPGYMLVTSLLFGATTFAFNWLLDDGTKSRRLLLSFFSIIYLSSTGVLFASSMGFMLKWGLSPLLAILSAAFFVRSGQPGRNRKAMLVIAWLFLLLSWASFSSAIILMALLIVGLIQVASQLETAMPVRVIRAKLSVAILVVSTVLAFIGIRLAELNPPINPLTGTAGETVDLLSSIDIASILLSGLAATLAALVSVTVSIPLHDNQINSWLVIAFRDYVIFAAAVLAMAIGLIYLIRKSLPSRQLALLFLLLLAANMFLAAARSPLIHRYQTLWIPIAVLVILSLLGWLSSINLRAVANIIFGVILIAALISAWHIGTNSLAIATIERQRDIADSAKLANTQSCLQEASASLEQIAPTITAGSLCGIMKILKDRSWIFNR